MIAFLRGRLVERLSDSVVIDVGGVGYEVLVHSRAMPCLPARGQETMLFTRLQTSDNDFRLYGFIDREELDLFKILISIGGLGPKTALGILGHFAPEEFFRVVAAQDLKTLTRVPGVGKKSGERILFELKDRSSAFKLRPDSEGSQGIDALLEALATLGYSRSEVYNDVINLLENEGLSNLEDDLKKVLKARGRGLAR